MLRVPGDAPNRRLSSATESYRPYCGEPGVLTATAKRSNARPSTRNGNMSSSICDPSAEPTRATRVSCARIPIPSTVTGAAGTRATAAPSARPLPQLTVSRRVASCATRGQRGRGRSCSPTSASSWRRSSHADTTPTTLCAGFPKDRPPPSLRGRWGRVGDARRRRAEVPHGARLGALPDDVSRRGGAWIVAARLPPRLATLTQAVSCAAMTLPSSQTFSRDMPPAFKPHAWSRPTQHHFCIHSRGVLSTGAAVPSVSHGGEPHVGYAVEIDADTRIVRFLRRAAADWSLATRWTALPQRTRKSRDG
jgi:hypothetical protein